MTPLNPTPTTPEEAASKAANIRHAKAVPPPTVSPPPAARADAAPPSLPPPTDRDPLVPPVQLTKEQAKIKAALIRGCSSTDVDNVWVDTGQVLKVLALETCEAAGLFTYTVEATETITQKRRPNSIIPQSALTRSKGLSEVNRELLLQLLAR